MGGGSKEFVRKRVDGCREVVSLGSILQALSRKVSG